MNIPVDQAVYRVRRFLRKDNRPKQYQYSLELTDDRTQQVMATCDLAGKAIFSTLTIVDHQQLTWQVRPNRKIMPSRWVVTDPRQHITVQFDQKILGKLVNPLSRVVLVMLDDGEKEICRLVDPRTSLPDRVLGAGPDELAIMDGDQVLAKLGCLPKTGDQPTSFWGKLKAFLTTSDRGIVSAGGTHALQAPVALGMLMISDDLIKNRGD
jgi:hypothetical protein